jgi:heme/copper-type cytochrome/quinol oxidase subunit 2
MLVAAAWLVSVAPAWANAADPELYPEAAERYSQGMNIAIAMIVGCFALIVIVVIAAVVLIIRWLVRRSRRPEAAAEDQEAPEMP